MTGEKGEVVEKLQLIGKAREDQYFRQIDEQLIETMHRETDERERERERLRSLLAKLLVPIDLSSSSRLVLSYAADIAERFESSIIVVHVVHHESLEVRATERHPSRPFVMGERADIEDGEMQQLVEEHREKGYEEMHRFLPPRLRSHPVELRLLMGHPAERIVETATAEKVDMIVMGTHGRSGFRRWVAGSVAERVVRSAPCAVLTVKEPAEGGR